MPTIGYRIAQDQQSLLSYSYDGPVMSIDPVSSGGSGWNEFLVAFNEFSSHHGGKSLLNQTPHLTSMQVANAFDTRLETFRDVQRRIDPQNRFLTHHFAALLGIATKETATGDDGMAPSTLPNEKT